MKLYRVTVWGFLLLLFSSVWAGKANTYYRVFWNPTFHGQLLDYCEFGGKSCGRPVANAFCKKMGYPRAVDFIKAHNVGLTHYLDERVGCKGWTCDGFQKIRCASEMESASKESWHYAYKKFPYPRFDNYRVAWCYDGKSGCGRRAAYSFCRRMGFLNVKSYKKQANYAATRAIGNQKLCFHSDCTAFSEISCKR